MQIKHIRLVAVKYETGKHNSTLFIYLDFRCLIVLVSR